MFNYTNSEYKMYYREKPLTIMFDEKEQRFVLVSPSAQETEAAVREAQQVYASAVKSLPETFESIKTLYSLQSRDILCEAILQTEREMISQKASRTLAPDSEDYDNNLFAKTEEMINTRRIELTAMNKEELIDKLAGLAIDKQLQAIWTYAIINAMLVNILHDENKQRVFISMDEMKENMPAEVMEKLYEAVLSFMNERGEAKVFPNPHTSNV